MQPPQARQFLESLFQAAVGAAMPDKVVPQHLPKPPTGRTIVVGAGVNLPAAERLATTSQPYAHFVPRIRRARLVPTIPRR